ncbi:MAG TPA: HAD family hydrolase [Planctomycetota bacterium]|jgi:putative hydrolase of the HAD superfamily|nr:HAD family hydrolase [Planctomycetota bacterium]
MPARPARPAEITHLFFDAGNTLVYVNMEVVAETLARLGLRAEPAELWRAEHRARRIVDDPAVIRGSTDRTRWALYFAAILREWGLRDSGRLRRALGILEARHARANLWEVVPPEVPPALDRLRRRFRLAVISNSNGTVRRKLAQVGLLPYFDLVVDSHEEGIEKPDPRIFRLALERLRASPGRAVHVGDFYHIDVVGARAAGVRPVLLDPGDTHGDKPVRRLRSVAELPACVDGRSPVPI